ncbi:MAG TPA: TetR/AcrR family transcriptional regulator [Candidatus Dormibacteraeota bacterium]|nr:TetR/AcrR family transcriptional regulator [Candidatus Dormibacteraeota bacterium]
MEDNAKRPDARGEPEASPPSPVAGSRRERRRLATRRSIQAAAIELALQRGLENVTVQAISDAADIAPSTFFTYFGSKDAALSMDVPWNEARVRTEILARPEGEPVLTSVREVAKVIAADFTSRVHGKERWSELFTRYPQLAHQVDLVETIRRGIAQGLAERWAEDAESEARIALLATVAVAVGELAIERWGVDSDAPGTGRALESYIDELFDLLEQGFEPGRNR